MKIVVLIKQVPEASEIKFDEARRTIVREGIENVVNPFDRRAVGKALELKARYGGEVVVMTMGPPQAKEALLECLGAGADRAIHLCDRAFAGSDTLATARALALAIEKRVGEFDLILAGKFSTDAETGQVGPEVAEILGVPHMTSLSTLELEEDGARFLLVGERELDDGFEKASCPLPAMATAGERLARPPKVSPEEMEAARTKPFEVLTARDLSQSPALFGLEGSPTYVAEIRRELTFRERRMLQGVSSNAAAQAIIEYLIEQGLFTGWRAGAARKPELPGKVRNGEGGRDVWVWGEVTGGSSGAGRSARLRSGSRELLAKANEIALQLGGRAICLLLGADGAAWEDVAAEATAYGADAVFTVSDDRLEPYTAEAYALAVSALLEAHGPYAFLVPATPNGRDFTPRVAARLGLGLTGDCIGLELDEEGRLVQLKPAFGGEIVAPILCRTQPYMATVRPGVFEAAEPNRSRQPSVTRLTIQTEIPAVKRIIERRIEVGEAADLENAEIIIGVGSGLGGPENLPLAERLAQELGGVLGATRRIVDAGWMPRQHQIGLTGRMVAPELYLALGARGAPNHTIGFKKAQRVVAINSDPDAPIFQACSLGVVGDLFEIAPALLDGLKSARKQAKVN